jgi:lipopolysaccharide transport system permease protein
MRKLLTDISSHRELLAILVARNLKVRYKGSFLGFFWTLLSPLFLILIYSVFLSILKTYQPGDPNFMPALVVGIIAWQFVAMCLGDSLFAIMGNVALVKKTAFPRIILPLSTVSANLVNFLLSSVVLFVYLQIAHMPMSNIYWYPVILLTQFALCLGMALILSCSNVFFRDTQHILGIGMLAWFFLSPIIYGLDRIPERFRELVFLNPLAGIVTAYRCVLMSAECPSPRLLVMSGLVCWLVLVIGIGVFQRSQVWFGDEL